MERLFSTPGHFARQLTREDWPRLQALFAANAEGVAAVLGAPPTPAAAQEVFEDLPPADIPYGARWFLGFFDEAGQLQGVADVLRDLCAQGVWHIAVYLWARPLHGSGAAGDMHRALQAWAVASGARWLRLGVIAGNQRAGRFWERLGYSEVRRREMPLEGARAATVRVMVKPLFGQSTAEYLARVPRDAPEPHPSRRVAATASR